MDWNPSNGSFCFPTSASEFSMNSQMICFSSSNGDDFGGDDSVLCVPGSKLVPEGFKEIACKDDCVIFVNSGGGPLKGHTTQVNIESDSYFQGGDVLRTEECIIDGGDYASLYQSARFGNFSYGFKGLSFGDYYIDLHFAEIVNTNGPKGMRVFDVFVQEEKVLSELDIYAVVGANKPLQMVDARIHVKEDGVLVVRFEGIRGSPSICGICIRRASTLPAPKPNLECPVCNNCSTKIEVSPSQRTTRTIKPNAKYEKKIQELQSQCQLKTDECYEAWMSLTAANEQLEKLRMELDNKLFKSESLVQAMDQQTKKLKNVCYNYERDKKLWAKSICDLEEKVKIMKQEHFQLSQDAKRCAGSIPDLNKMISAVEALVVQSEHFKLLYNEEQGKRKKLYNEIQETKGNIRVFCRCRPLSKEEVASGCVTTVDFDAAKDGELGLLTGGSTKKTFKFDRVFTPRDDQADVFADASPLVMSVLDGYNVCIFAYGQTGTGKTFTMEGTEKNRGVNYRTLRELFTVAEERRETNSYNISVSVLEVYNEQIRDLLNASPATKKLEVRQAAEGVHHVPGIVEADVRDIKEVWDVLQAGSNSRAVGSNNVNEHSSRSHCLLCINVRAKNLMSGECTKSKLWLVDLAGSERLAKTDAQGERLKEAQNINKSLSALGDVISALATKSSHIPYRNSKLTHLLQDSLGGDSKALMFVQISPSNNDLSETLSSLNFATRVRGIELGPAKKQMDMGELQKMKTMVDKARQECRSKDESLKKLEENYQNLESKVRGKDEFCRNLQDKVKELEGQLGSKMEQQSHSEKQHWQLTEKLKGKEEMCVVLHQKVKDLENRFKEQQNSEFFSLQQKVRELEMKLEEQQRIELVGEQKVRELENKLREREVQLETMALSHSIDPLRVATPQHASSGKNEEESMNECDSHVLRSSNSINRPPAHNMPGLLKGGVDPPIETRRKRPHRGELENNFAAPTTSFIEKSTYSNELRTHKKIETEKVYNSRFKRMSSVSVAKKAVPHNRLQKQEVGGVKDRDSRTSKGWSR